MSQSTVHQRHHVVVLAQGTYSSWSNAPPLEPRTCVAVRQVSATSRGYESAVLVQPSAVSRPRLTLGRLGEGEVRGMRMGVINPAATRPVLPTG